MVIRPLAQIIWLLQNIINIITDDNIYDFILFVDWKFRHIDTIINYIELNGIIKIIFISSAYIICLFNSESKKKNTGIRRVTNKRPMGHIAHLRKQFKSINTYDYIMTLIKRRKNKNIINFMRIYCFFIWTNLNPLHTRMLCAKFGWNFYVLWRITLYNACKI